MIEVAHVCGPRFVNGAMPAKLSAAPDRPITHSTKTAHSPTHGTAQALQL